MSFIPYDRLSAVNYAKKWAYERNPKFYNFDSLGGDCTNFVSQCIFDGTKVMNFAPVSGWFYISLNNRAPAWTGVEFLYKFLTTNNGKGPIAKEVNSEQISLGDVIELGDINGRFYHTLIVTKIENGKIFTASHSVDSLDRALDSYRFNMIRFIHILGAKK